MRRINPAPKSRVPKGEVVTEPDDNLAGGEENLIDVNGDEAKNPHGAMRRMATVDGHVAKVNGQRPEPPGSPKKSSILRRTSSVHNSSDRENGPKKAMSSEMREHLKHLGPSNLASRPRTTRYNTVKIKPGAGLMPEGLKGQEAPETPRLGSIAAQEEIGGRIVNSAGKDAKDGVLALQAGYGSIPSGSPPSPKKSRKGSLVSKAEASKSTPNDDVGARPRQSKRTNSQSTLGSMYSGMKSPRTKRGPARSGSITENIIDVGGIKKTVLEMTSSSEDAEEAGAQISGDAAPDEDLKGNDGQAETGGKKKRRRRKRKAGGTNEDTPLLGDDNA